jgi:hypothetical protein
MSNKYTAYRNYVHKDGNPILRVLGLNKETFPIAIDIAERLDALAGIEDPKQWVEEMKNYDMQLAEAWEQGSVDARNKNMFEYSKGLNIDNPYRDKMNWEHHENIKFRLKFQNEQLQAENEKLKEVLKEISNIFKPKELSVWDFVEEVRNKAKEALKEDQEPPTWESRDAWEGGFADNH